MQMLTLEKSATASKYDRVHFAIIRLVHESLYGLFVDPYRRLSKARVKAGQRVLEVGCGPGYFTIPAAKIVGEKGHVYALDINPAAVEHVKRKIDKEGLTNVEAKPADASVTGLQDESIDLAFLFSVFHAFENVNKVLAEMHRVLKANGTLSIQSRIPEEKLLPTMTAEGLFHLAAKDEGIYVFEKS